MKVAWNIASRFLKSNRGQTILIVIGIAIGVSVQIFIGSLIDGLQVSLVDKTIGSSSHITIIPKGKDNFFQEDENLIRDLENNKNLTAVSKSLDLSAFIYYKDEGYPVFFRGMEFEDGNKIYKFNEKLIDGNLPSGNGEVILGKDLVDDLEIKIGDTLPIATPGNEEKDIKLVGIYDFKVANINESWIISDIETSENIFNKKGELSSIETQVGDVFAADTIASDIEKGFTGDKLETLNWKAQNEELLSGLTGQSASSYLIQVFVLLAVLLGISSVLAISVVQKSRQIGILKAMGIKNRVASLIFLFQGMILGSLGGVIGTILGVSLTFIFSTLIKNPDGTPLIPFYLDYGFVLISVVVAIVASTIASFIPARKSSKLNPIEVIKNG